jgi:NodT family efflux transporter outer membrane factor (OMF) lipoprotein
MKTTGFVSLPMAAAIASVLAACATPAGLAPQATQRDVATLASKDSLAAPAPAAWPGSQWWIAYGDPQLDALVAEALAGSPTLAVARSRIAQAEAVAEAAGAARMPTLAAGATADRQRYSENGIFPPPIAGSTLTTGAVAMNFNYEFDFWGRERAALDAALSRARAAAVEGEAARLALAVAVVQAYVELEHQYALQDVAEASRKQREQVRDLTQSRVGAGLETKVELRQSASQVFAARTEVAAAEERVALLRDQLAALLGQGPDRGFAIARPQLAAGAATGLPADLPAQLLGRRPDIVAERLRVEAAGRDIAAARARFYPSVNLGAMVGLQSVGLDLLRKSGSRVFDVNGGISLPLFDGGRLRANLSLQDAAYDEAVEQYNATLVGALRDVADQINSWRAIDRQDEEQKQALSEAEEAYRLAMLRYQEGLSSYLTVLTVESQVLAQRRLAADLRARRLGASIGLARALGGGFHDVTLTAAETH